MRRFYNYENWSLNCLRKRRKHIRKVIVRLTSNKFPCRANKLVLTELDRVIQLKIQSKKEMHEKLFPIVRT